LAIAELYICSAFATFCIAVRTASEPNSAKQSIAKTGLPALFESKNS